MNDVASTCIGTTRCSCKEWISDTTWDLIERKTKARFADMVDAYRSLNKECRASVRKDRQRWADEKAEAGERAWATGQLKDAFSNFRQLRSATKTVSSPIMNKAGILISD